MVQEGVDFYLPDNCWELVLKFLIADEDQIHRRYLLSKEDKKKHPRNLMLCLSLVSKQFLSIINLLRFSLTIFDNTHSSFSYIFRRFPNLTSLNLIFCKLDKFDMLLIADCFPNLRLLDLSHSYDISKEGIGHVLRRCCNIRHLNLAKCYGVKLPNMNFEVRKLEVLNLSYTDKNIDDETLYDISKSCRGLLHLLLEDCKTITEKGLMCVVENCTQLREINFKGCVKVHANVVTSMVISRPSLRKIIVPSSYRFNYIETELFSRQGCLVCSSEVSEFF